MDAVYMRPKAFITHMNVAKSDMIWGIERQQSPCSRLPNPCIFPCTRLSLLPQTRKLSLCLSSVFFVHLPL